MAEIHLLRGELKLVRDLATVNQHGCTAALSSPPNVRSHGQTREVPESIHHQHTVVGTELQSFTPSEDLRPGSYEAFGYIEQLG